uniref:THAP domain-containing protein 1 n=1 Tax=Oryzias latipes TaxID=8090 RepID=A0A3P9LY33_ORYLA
MVHTCCVDSCSTEKRPNVIFHRFPPADPERLRQWLLALDMDPDTPNFILGKLFVCQKHFLPDDYHDPHMHLGRRARLLKSKAVPSQFLTPRFCEGGQLSPDHLDQLVTCRCKMLW